jgi:ectoine hydroxylase-related dioxygenase (phytanoyl-CoA dioxygenase family)
MKLTQEQIAHFRDQGYLLVENVITLAQAELLRAAIEQLNLARHPGDQGLSTADNYLTVIHDLPKRPGPLGRIIQYRPVLEMVQQLIGEQVRVTGGLLLDKDPRHNWEVPWHRDTGIYVEKIPPGEKDDVRGGLPVYSTRGLELIGDVTCRLALDPALPDSGGLYVLPGTHRQHLGDNKNVAALHGNNKGVSAPQSIGSALFYNPLTLHRSEKMTASQQHRRILHLSWGPADLRLPDGAEVYPWPQPCPLTPVDALV